LSIVKPFGEVFLNTIARQASSPDTLARQATNLEALARQAKILPFISIFKFHERLDGKNSSTVMCRASFLGERRGIAIELAGEKIFLLNFQRQRWIRHEFIFLERTKRQSGGSKIARMSKSEAGRIGGLQTKSRYGSGFYARIGRKGGGRGGNKTKARYGTEHFRIIGRKGGLH